MANSYVQYAGNGVVTNFSVTFPYLSQTHISASVDAVDTEFAWVNSTTISITPAPADGTIVRLSRATPFDAAAVDFQDGALLNEEQLDTATQQLLYIVQESRDNTLDNSTSFEQLTKRYLGGRATAPTTDNDGGALLSGAQYFNTVDGLLYNYYDGAWQNVAPANVINVVTRHGAPTDLTDCTDELTAAIADFNTNGGILFFPKGEYSVGAALPQITFHGGRIVGSGMMTRLWMNFTSGFLLDIRCHFTSVEHIAFYGMVWCPNARAINIQGGYRNYIANCSFSWMGGAVTINGSATAVMHKCELRYIQGSVGINITGTEAQGTFGFQLSHVIANNPPPLAYGAIHPLANDAAFLDEDFALNEIFSAFGYIWQCTQAGHTAASGDLNVLTSTYFDWALTDVTHGTAKFRTVCRADHRWIVMGSYSNSVTTSMCGLINGGVGFVMQDEVGISGSHPSWSYHYDLETDHPYYGGVLCTGGLGFWMVAGWIGSCLVGHGMSFQTDWLGETTVIGSRIMGNGLAGVAVLAGTDHDISNNVLSTNSATSLGTWPGVLFEDVTGIQANHNRGGTIIGIGENWQKCAVEIRGSSDWAVAVYNIGRGNVDDAAVVYAATGTNKIVTPNLGT